MSENIKGKECSSKLNTVIYSPFERLFNLTSNVKQRLKNSSYEKRTQKNIDFSKREPNNENTKNAKIINKAKKNNQSFKEIKESNAFNYINNNQIYNTSANNEDNNRNSCIHLQNNIININNNQYNCKRKVINTIILNNKRKILSPSFNTSRNNNKKKKEKNIKSKKGQIDKNKNIGEFKFKRNKNKLSNNNNINYCNNISRNRNKEYKSNVPELEMPYLSKYIFSSKRKYINQKLSKRNYNKANNIIKNKINLSQTIDNYRKKDKIKDIEINYRNSIGESEMNINSINNITEEIQFNSTIANYNNITLDNFSINKKSNKYTINTNLISLLDNNIYSPKKGIVRIHSQENISSNNNKKLIKDKRINIFWMNKHKSLKDLTRFTYKKKNCSYIIPKKENFKENKTYIIKPDIYPEIKINLKNKIKPLNKNNSVIYESKNKNDLNWVYKKNKVKRYDSESCSRSYKLKNFKDNNIFIDIDTKEYLLQDNINNEETISSFMSNTELNYIILSLEKIKDIFDSLSLSDSYFTLKYCFEFINYIYNYNIDNYISNSIINIIDIETRKILNNYFIFAIVVIYDLILKEKKLFNNLKILVKESIKLIYSNIIIIINYSKDNIIFSNNIFLNAVINNINIQYMKNKDLYIDDNEYLLIKQNNNSIISPENKLNYNLNFIIKNIHTIINNIKKSKDYKLFIQIFQQINNISLENIYYFYINNILHINIINSTLTTASKLTIQNNNINKIILNKKKYTLLISLDETLIHFKIDSKIKNNNKGIIQLRPGLNEFLSEIKPYYEIIAFSNGNKKYTDLLINLIDKKKIFFDNKLYREHCNIIDNDFVKDITKIGKDLTKIVIVDNLVQNYRLNKENGINIKSFYGEINDQILFELGKILIKIAKFKGDIRKGISYYKDDIINKVSSNIYHYYYK